MGAAMSLSRWILPAPTDPAAVQRLVREAGVARFVAEVLLRRGVLSPAEAQRFLDPRLKSLSDPFALPNMDAAVTRIFAALDGGEKIALYGDYDVDGVT